MLQLRSENGMQHAPAFDLLVQETRLMTREPIGVGLDVPAWLSALEEEVERVLDGSIATAQRPRYESAVPTLRMTVEEIESQLNATAKRYQTRSLPQEKTDDS
jgi:hypothetical protein